jgi:hypothetical protein
LQHGHLRAGHHQHGDVFAGGLAGIVGGAVIERQQGDALACGKARVIGDFAHGIGTETPGAAIVELDFHARAGAGAQPCQFGKRQIAFGGHPRVGRGKLHLHRTLELAQAGETRRARQQGGRNQKQREQSHTYSG